MLFAGYIGLRFGPLTASENPSVTPVDAVDYSDNYKWWDNKQTATVEMTVWDADSADYVAKTYENVVVKRSTASSQNPEIRIQLRNDQAVWLVPVALIGGYPMRDGAEITVGSDLWVQSGDAPLRVVGSSPSHYVCVCNKGRV